MRAGTFVQSPRQRDPSRRAGAPVICVPRKGSACRVHRGDSEQWGAPTHPRGMAGSRTCPAASREPHTRPSDPPRPRGCSRAVRPAARGRTASTHTVPGVAGSLLVLGFWSRSLVTHGPQEPTGTPRPSRRAPDRHTTGSRDQLSSAFSCVY